MERDSVLKSEVIGTNISDGLPNTAEISSKEIFTAIAPHVKQFAIAVRSFLKQIPEDRKSDVVINGLMLTGGGSLLYGLPKLLEEVTSLSVTVAKDPIASALSDLRGFPKFCSLWNFIGLQKLFAVSI